MNRFVVVKSQYQKKDGTKGYGIYLVDRLTAKVVRILTFKDDKRGYALLEAIAIYIGERKPDEVISNPLKEEFNSVNDK